MSEFTFDAIMNYLKPGQRRLGKSKEPTKENLTQDYRMKKEISEQISDFISTVFGPARLASNLMMYSPEAEASIRPGGNPLLNLFHGTSARNAISGGSPRPLSNPSLAISRRSNPFPSDLQLLGNPNSQQFDPILNPMALLYNTDAFVSRARGNLGSVGDLRMSEGGGPFVGEPNRFMELIASPLFPSFSAFESSIAGAGKLKPVFNQQSSDSTNVLRNRAGELLKQITGYHGVQTGNKVLLNAADGNDLTRDEMEQVYDLIKKQAAAGDKDARRLMRLYATNPQTYAELKVLDEVMPDSSNFVAGIIPPMSRFETKKVWGQTDPAYRSQLEKYYGIPIGTAKELMPQSKKAKYSDMAEDITAKIVAAADKTDYIDAERMTRKIAEQHGNYGITQNAADYWMSHLKAFGMSESELKSKVLGTMQQSDQYGADLATLLTEPVR